MQGDFLIHSLVNFTLSYNYVVTKSEPEYVVNNTQDDDVYNVLALSMLLELTLKLIFT